MFKTKYKVLLGLVAIPLIAIFTLARCGSSSPATTTTSSTASNYIYVASGNSYAGNGVTPYTPSNTIVRYTTAGVLDRVVFDYSQYPGDTPVALINYDSKRLLVAIENATNLGGRRIDLVNKDGSGFTNYIANSAVFGAAANVITDLALTPDGGTIITRGIASPSNIEKFSSTKQRILLSNIAFVNNPLGGCISTNRRIQHLVMSPQGNIIASHPQIGGLNKLIMINSNGYQALADCFASQAAPGATYFPTAMLMHSSGQLLVGYVDTTPTPNIETVYQYGVTASSFTGGTSAYTNFNILQGISAMAEKIDDTTVYIAASGSTAGTLFNFNAVYQFTYSSTAGTLTLVGSGPIIPPSVYTKSISAILAPGDGQL